MDYYRVPAVLDGKQVPYGKGKYYPLYEGELLTKKECQKIGISLHILQFIRAKRTQIYFFFGKRFFK